MAFIGLCCKEWNQHWFQTYFKKGCQNYLLFFGGFFSRSLPVFLLELVSVLKADQLPEWRENPQWSLAPMIGAFPLKYLRLRLGGLATPLWWHCICWSALHHPFLSIKVNKTQLTPEWQSKTVNNVITHCVSKELYLVSIFHVKMSRWQWIEINQVTDVQTQHLFIVFPHWVKVVLRNELCCLHWHQKMNSLIFNQNEH